LRTQGATLTTKDFRVVKKILCDVENIAQQSHIFATDNFEDFCIPFRGSNAGFFQCRDPNRGGGRLRNVRSPTSERSLNPTRQELSLIRVERVTGRARRLCFIVLDLFPLPYPVTSCRPIPPD
jgi:hypothetical protein